jgi:lipoprotein-releasing system permease protein
LSGIYEVRQVEVDDQYALVPLSLARELIGLSNDVTSVELGLKEGANTDAVQKRIQETLGNGFKVQNRYQQHESYYNVAKSEQFFIFLILSFILLIASFNLAGSITMLILDKKKDIHILQSLGLTRIRIGKVFLIEGIMVSLIGDLIGLVLGVLLSLVQMRWGWLKFPGSFAIESYPVELRLSNLVIIAITVLVIGTVVSWLPVKLLPKHFFEISQD